MPSVSASLAALTALAALLALPARAQPTPLVVEDQRGPRTAAGRPGLAAEHPWVPDVMALAGVRDPGEPIRVLLAPEGSLLAKGVPPWVSGYTDGVSSVVVLLPERTPSYPDGAMEEVLAHEVAHVMVARATGGRPVPRWFNEGVAMVAGRSWELGDRARTAIAVLSGGRIPLERLDALFHGDRAAVERGYALSGALVQDLLERYGPGLPRALFLRLSRGETFDEALREVTGSTLLDVELSFFSRRATWGRWFSLLTSAAVLWLGISLLAIAAGARRRRLRKEALARLAAEEEAAAAAAGDPPVEVPSIR